MRTKDFLSLIRDVQKLYTFDAMITSLSTTSLDEYTVSVFGRGIWKENGSAETATHTNVPACDIEPGRKYTSGQWVKVYFLDILEQAAGKEKLAIIHPYFDATQMFEVMHVIKKTDNITRAGYVRATSKNSTSGWSGAEILINVRSVPQVGSIIFAHKPVGGTLKKVEAGDNPLGNFTVNTPIEWEEISAPLPPGGRRYDVLQKNSNSDFDAIWGPVRSQTYA